MTQDGVTVIPLKGWGQAPEEFATWVINTTLTGLVGTMLGLDGPAPSKPRLHTSSPGVRESWHLPSLDDLLAAVVRETAPEYVCVVTDRERHPPVTYSLAGRGHAVPANIPDPYELLRLFDSGATIEYQRVERRFASVRRIARAMALVAGGPVQTSAFMTPPAQQAYGRHFDPYDVLVVQTFGSKRWTLWEPSWPDPLPHQNSAWTAGLATGATTPSVEVHDDMLLGAGDVLWLPRGWDHEVVAVSDTSVHLSFIASPSTVMDALSESLQLAQADGSLRRALTTDPISDSEAFATALGCMSLPAMTPLRLRAAASLSPFPLRFVPRSPQLDDGAYLAAAALGSSVVMHLGDKIVRLPANAATLDATGRVEVNLSLLAENDLRALALSGLLIDCESTSGSLG